MKTLSNLLATTSLITCLCASNLHATTWDEPWQKKIISDTYSIVRVSVTKAEPKRVDFRVLKHIAGEEVPKSGALVGFSKLEFGSYSVEEDGFRFREGMEYYLFLEETEKSGEYKIATPTAGFASTKDGQTTATYRHIYHQAYVPDPVYEMSIIAIFKAVKNQNPDLSKARAYIASELAKKPADIPDGVESEEFRRFCSQHVALEMLYYLGGGDTAQLEPFLTHKNPHGQISAVRALGRLPKEASQPRLLAFIEAKDSDSFAKVMAVWALRDSGAKDAASKLKRILETTEDQESGFGGNIMDPRVGTHFPGSVHKAIAEVLANWDKSNEHDGRRQPATRRESK